MSRVLSCAAIAVLSALVFSCDGDSKRRSPTEPAPPVTAPVSLPGEWAGTMTVSRSGGPAATCTLSLTVQDDGDPQIFTGNWTLRCPDGTQGTALVVAVSLPFSFASLSGFPSTTVLDGCSWGSLMPRQGRKLTGDWTKPSNPSGTCLASSIQGGTVDLTKVE